MSSAAVTVRGDEIKSVAAWNVIASVKKFPRTCKKMKKIYTTSDLIINPNFVVFQDSPVLNAVIFKIADIQIKKKYVTPQAKLHDSYILANILWCYLLTIIHACQPGNSVVRYELLSKTLK